MRRLAALVSSRRGKWAVVVGWLVLVGLLAPVGGKLAHVTDNRTESFLPKSAESTKVLHLLDTQFAGGHSVTGLVVYSRSGGLTAADRRKIAEDARRAEAVLPLVGTPVVPFQPGSPRDLVSRNGDVAYTALAVPDDNNKAATWGKDLRRITSANANGLRAFVTGDLGFNADAQEVFNSLDVKLLVASVLLVLVLLGLIYRSPTIAVIPLVVVGVAYAIARGLIYLYAKSGASVSDTSTAILVVLMFGVGTDYCLLLVARYREELRSTPDKHAAMSRALQRAGPAILASGATVCLTMLVLLVAENGTIHALGPVAAIGVACVLGAGLTLLPALLTIVGRRGFWPRGRLVAYDGGSGRTERRGVWRVVGDHVLRRPALALGVTVAIFAVGAVGLFAYRVDDSTTAFFKKRTESVDGFKVLERTFPAGTLAPTTVLVGRDDGQATPADVANARRRLAAVPGVARVTQAVARSRNGRIAELEVILTSDPFTSTGLDRVPALRGSVSGLGPNVRALVGGGSAVQYDYNAASARDLRLIVPLALAVVALILALLLRALVAPLVLIATVVASFFGTFGLSLVFIRYVAGEGGIDNSLPTFAFIFLVALGVDYTIFLMSRVREEARRHGTREGMLRALGSTGGVITSAGVILAGTFSVLLTLPVTFTFNLGFMVAAGILLDTFIVRTIMVPAVVELLGDRIWWPSNRAGGGALYGAPRPGEPLDRPAAAG